MISQFRLIKVIAAGASQLTYNRTNGLGSGFLADTDSGLTEYGKQVLARMEKVGMAVDLSHAAARSIEMIGPGTAQVRLEVIRTPAAPVVSENVTYGVQAGAFRNRTNAERSRTEMASRYGTARVVARPGDTALWRVLVGSETTEEAAEALAERIRQEISERNAFVVRLDIEWLTASSAGLR